MGLSTGASEADFRRWEEKIKKLAMAKFAGKETNILVNEESVDTFFEAPAKNGECDADMVERARNDIGNAAKKGDNTGEGKTVVKTKGVDSTGSKCQVVYQTQCTKGKNKEAARAINAATEVGIAKDSGKRFRSLESGSSSVSSTPTEEEVPEGGSPESQDYAGGDIAPDSESGSGSGSGSGSEAEPEDGETSVASGYSNGLQLITV